MKKYKGRFIANSSIQECCFCDLPLNHIKKEKEGKILICKCGAEFIVFGDGFYEKILKQSSAYGFKSVLK